MHSVARCGAAVVNRRTIFLPVHLHHRCLRSDQRVREFSERPAVPVTFAIGRNDIEAGTVANSREPQVVRRSTLDRYQDGYPAQSPEAVPFPSLVRRAMARATARRSADLTAA
jgi:hypothetical protein